MPKFSVGDTVSFVYKGKSITFTVDEIDEFGNYVDASERFYPSAEVERNGVITSEGGKRSRKTRRNKKTKRRTTKRRTTKSRRR